MPTPLLLGGQEFIYFNENPFKNNYKKKLNTTKISDKDAINKRTITGASNESIYKIIIQYLFYTIILLNLALLYLIFDNINRKKRNLVFNKYDLK
jgi:hypothetical protein